jgi:hypothetical protein
MDGPLWTWFRRLLRGTVVELLAVVALPLGDQLTCVRNHTSAEVEGDELVVRFDLDAD